MYSNYDNHSEQSEQNDQEQGCCQLSNPLDYLVDEEIDEQLMMPRKPRSSIESSDRRLEIPACQPAYISRHLRDSFSAGVTSQPTFITHLSLRVDFKL